MDKESYENLNQEVDDAFIQWYISPVSNQKVDVFSIECGTGNVLFKEPQLSFVQDRNGNVSGSVSIAVVYDWMSVADSLNTDTHAGYRACKIQIPCHCGESTIPSSYVILFCESFH